MNAPIPNILSWPLGGIEPDGRLPAARDDASVRDVMLNILLTRPGERLMRPAFGAGLLDYVHQPNNQTTRSLIANLVRKALEQWETRVVVEAVEVMPDPASPAEAHIQIRYRMRHSLPGGAVPRELGLSLTLGVHPGQAGR